MNLFNYLQKDLVSTDIQLLPIRDFLLFGVDHMASIFYIFDIMNLLFTLTMIYFVGMHVIII